MPNVYVFSSCEVLEVHEPGVTNLESGTPECSARCWIQICTIRPAALFAVKSREEVINGRNKGNESFSYLHLGRVFSKVEFQKLHS